MNLEVSTTFCLFGVFPNEVEKQLVSAVKSVPTSFFFDNSGTPLKKYINGFDEIVAETLQENGWQIKRNYTPFSDSFFNVDLAAPNSKLLIEIEKGELPRIELDIIKITSACLQCNGRWEYGALVVPASYIKLKLANGTATQYLQRLKPLVHPLLKVSQIKGLLVIGYKDPRGNDESNSKRSAGIRYQDAGSSIKVKASKRHLNKSFSYWWDIAPTFTESIENYEAIEFVKTDTNESCVVSIPDIKPFLLEGRKTSRQRGNWGVKVLNSTPDSLAFEPGRNGGEWLYLPVKWEMKV